MLVTVGDERICEVFDGFGPFFGFEGTGEHSGVTDDFWDRRGTACDDRASTGHGFERGNAKAFVKGGEAEDEGARVEFAELRTRDRTEEVDAILEGLGQDL